MFARISASQFAPAERRSPQTACYI